MNIFAETLGRLFFILPSKPGIVQIEVTNKCNLNCPMCPREFLNVGKTDMDFEVFKKVADRLVGVREIILTGWGEPLMHPQIVEMIKYCSEFGLKTRLTTNGILLNENLAQKIIESGLGILVFSIDSLNSVENALGHLEKGQIENIKNFAKRSIKPKIVFQTTIHKNRENDIFEIIKFAGETDVKEVNLVRLDIRFNPDLKRPDFEEEKRIVEKAVRLGDKLGVEVRNFPHSWGKGIFRKIFKLLKNYFYRGGKYCFRIYDYIYINLGGDITPCCSLPHYKLGSILDSSLEEIWNSEKFRKFRKNQKIVCDKCDVAYAKQIQQH